MIDDRMDVLEIAPGEESDFSFHKMRLGVVIMIAQTFTTPTLPLILVTFAMLPMTKEFGWTRVEFSFCLSALFWVGMIAGLVSGRVTDMIGVRRPILALSCLFALTNIALSFQTSNLWLFYGLFALQGIGSGSFLAYSKLIGGMFSRHRGKALALLGVEGTIASATLPFLLNWLVDDFGWRNTFLTLGLIGLGLVATLFLLVEDLKADVATDLIGTADAARPGIEGLGAREVLMDRVFWLIVIATTLGVIIGAGIWPHMIPLMAEKGFGKDAAVFLISAVNIIAPLGALVSGYAVDKALSARIAVPFKLLGVVGVVLILFITPELNKYGMLWLAAVCLGVFQGTTRGMNTYFHIRFFGMRSFGFYYAVESGILALVIGGVAPMVAYVYQQTGSYDGILIITAILLAISALLYVIVGPYRYSAQTGAGLSTRKDEIGASAKLQV